MYNKYTVVRRQFYYFSIRNKDFFIFDNFLGIRYLYIGRQGERFFGIIFHFSFSILNNNHFIGVNLIYAYHYKNISAQSQLNL